MPRSQLAAEWRFTDYGDQTLRDWSGGGRHMVLGANGSAAGDDPVWTRAGLTFAAASSQFCGNGSGVNVFAGTPLTIIAAVRATGTGARTIIGCSASSNGPQFRVNTSDKLELLKAGAVSIGTGTSNCNNTWLVVAVTYDGTTARFYRNGVPDGAGTSAQTMTVQSSYIGKRGSTDFFSGEMAYIVAYDRALTQAEVEYASTNIARHIGLLPARKRVWFAPASGGATIDLVATARAQSLANTALPVSRALMSTGRSQAQGNAALIRAIALQATDQGASRAQTALLRSIVLIATARSQAAGRVEFAAVLLALIATARAQSRATGVLQVGRALVASSIARSQAQETLARAVLLMATARAAGMGAAALPLARQMVATARSQARLSAVITPAAITPPILSPTQLSIIAARVALAAGLFTDTFTTERGSSGPCGVKNDSGDGTPITIHCGITADILPSDTVYINGRTYTVIDSHGTHGMSLAKHYTLQETARP